MSKWKVAITATTTLSLVVDTEDIDEWYPDLRASTGDNDEVLVGVWAERLDVDWEAESVQDGDSPLAAGDSQAWTFNESTTVEPVDP